ncbi:MAG: DUF4382 domain-containing protein [Holophagaceae bacterium]|nr:DUF4382 domain-containing protein [Holophagaceae bacterium]
MRALLVLACLALMVGCGCGCDDPGPSSQARVSVLLVDAPTADYKQINLDVQRVEISEAGSGWITLGEPRRVIDLLTLTNGLTATLASGASLPPGHYTQLRLVLGAANTVMLNDSSLQALKVPSGQQTGIKLNVDVTVAIGTTKEIYIDFDAAHSIQVNGAGPGGQYLLRPVIRAYDKLLTGSVTGTLRTPAGAGIGGAFVIAQSLDGTGTASLARQAQTAADGAFTLDLLPTDGTYFLATQPAVSATGYAAVGAGPFAVTAATPTFSTTLTTSALPVASAVNGTVAPPAGTDKGDLVTLHQSLVVGGTARNLIVRTTVPGLAAGVESFLFNQVELGQLTLRGLRTTVNPDGSFTTVPSLNAPVVNPQSASPVAAVLQF